VTPTEIKEKFDAITVWKRGERAPHKPLLALYAIGRALRGEPRMVEYAQVDQDLRKLLIEFGPRRQSYHPEYPFWHLQSDGLWELSETRGLVKRLGKNSPTKMALLTNSVQGGFPPEGYQELSSNNRLARQIVQDLLDANFPETMHRDILDEVGIDFAVETRIVVARDPEFRERVLRAYEYSCAVCGFDVRLGNIVVAVEAAHIKWYQAGGPDEERNGLALCSLHHKLFDRGVFTISNSMSVIVSERQMARGDFRNGSLRITERRLDRRSGQIIILLKVGSPGTCEKFSKVRVGIRIVISMFREFSKRGCA
jgi:putative restriction endonuclease